MKAHEREAGNDDIPDQVDRRKHEGLTQRGLHPIGTVGHERHPQEAAKDTAQTDPEDCAVAGYACRETDQREERAHQDKRRAQKVGRGRQCSVTLGRGAGGIDLYLDGVQGIVVIMLSE